MFVTCVMWCDKVLVCHAVCCGIMHLSTHRPCHAHHLSAHCLCYTGMTNFFRSLMLLSPQDVVPAAYLLCGE